MNHVLPPYFANPPKFLKLRLANGVLSPPKERKWLEYLALKIYRDEGSLINTQNAKILTQFLELYDAFSRATLQNEMQPALLGDLQKFCLSLPKVGSVKTLP